MNIFENLTSFAADIGGVFTSLNVLFAYIIFIAFFIFIQIIIFGQIYLVGKIVYGIELFFSGLVKKNAWSNEMVRVCDFDVNCLYRKSSIKKLYPKDYIFKFVNSKGKIKYIHHYCFKIHKARGNLAILDWKITKSQNIEKYIY